MQLKAMLITIVLLLSLTSCAYYDFSRRIVQQGNQLPESKIQRLKIGMSKEDAAILMGTSLLNPTFNNDHWDYAYTWRKGNRLPKVSHLTLYFAHDRLSRIEQEQ
jgi:outer membrane protein assembly factor BamE